jgi:cyclophilin family peptidyl-prolyl cis-trans isomerase
LALGAIAPLTAQDDAPPAKKPGTAKVGEAPSGDPVKEWKALMARRAQIETAGRKLQEDLQKLQEDPKAAKDPKARQELIAALQKLGMEFQREIMPKMSALAEPVLEKDPLNQEAAEMVAARNFQENRYKEAVAISDKMIEAGKGSAILLNVGGVSHFAEHNFAKAHEILTRASKEDQDLFPNLGANFLNASLDYQKLWTAEQAIRAKEAEANKQPETANPQVLFKTSKGDVLFELYEDQAPNTVANFISLVEKKKYDGIKFHRVIPNFMAQGGDPNTLDEDPSNDGQGGPGYNIECECYRPDARKHFAGTLSMAHAGKDTGGSQFFITHLPTPHLNPNAAVKRGHTVFGRVVQGLEVSNAIRPGDKIVSATVVRKRNHPYAPKTLAE